MDMNIARRATGVGERPARVQRGRVVDKVLWPDATQKRNATPVITLVAYG